VKLLLEQGDIDDSLRDIHGKTCKEVAKTKEIARVIEGMAFFQYSLLTTLNYRTQIHDLS